MDELSPCLEQRMHFVQNLQAHFLAGNVMQYCKGCYQIKRLGD